MLKRCQVLLEDWQVEHLKLISEKNDLSLSEMIRVVISEGLLHTCPYLYPECKGRIINEKDLASIAVEGANSKTPQERRHQLASKLYFEARKATEYMNSQILKEKKSS
jgi:hypothetical protein